MHYYKNRCVPCKAGKVTLFGVYEARQHTATDGTKFIPAIFYAVASRNIGILVESANGNHHFAFPDHLFASPEMAEQHAKDMVDVYNNIMTESEREHFKQNNGLL